MQGPFSGFRVGFSEENLGQVETESHFEFSWNIPDRHATIAEMYDNRELPGVPVRLMTGTPWCDEVSECVPVGDPARGHLTPKAESCELQNPMTCATILRSLEAQTPCDVMESGAKARPAWTV